MEAMAEMVTDAEVMDAGEVKAKVATTTVTVQVVIGNPDSSASGSVSRLVSSLLIEWGTYFTDVFL